MRTNTNAFCTLYGECVHVFVFPVRVLVCVQLVLSEKERQPHRDQNQRHILKLTPVKCCIITAS